ncbi:MAG: cyclase family protein [Anaerolineales bacterium]|jgi:arylformamidase|nr:cyclase family protein [Anaerolineales bacterium]
MTYHDISLTLSPDLAVWPGDPQIVFERTSEMAAGAKANVTRIALSAHTGTHLDAPLHFIEHGEDVTTLSLETLIGPAQLVEAADADMINAAVLDSLPIHADTERLIIKTRNSQLWSEAKATFRTDFAAVTASGAIWLVEHGIRLVGVDYLSVAPYGDSTLTHVTLLQAGVIPVEGLNLSAVQPGRYQLICLPLKLGGCEGAPARAVLVSGHDLG